MGAGPTKRTLALLRKGGGIAQKVEFWNAHARRRIDVFGFGDVISAGGDRGVALWQATTRSNVMDRVSKIREECADAASVWLESGGRIFVIGWAKLGARGERKLWRARILEIGFTEGDDGLGVIVEKDRVR